MEEIKRPNKKRESIATFIRASPKPTNDGNSTTEKANKKRELDDSPSRKGKKRSIPSMMMMFKGYLMN